MMPQQPRILRSTITVLATKIAIQIDTWGSCVCYPSSFLFFFHRLWCALKPMFVAIPPKLAFCFELFKTQSSISEFNFEPPHLLWQANARPSVNRELIVIFISLYIFILDNLGYLDFARLFPSGIEVKENGKTSSDPDRIRTDDLWVIHKIKSLLITSRQQAIFGLPNQESSYDNNIPQCL